MSTLSIASHLDRTRLANIADDLAVGVAISLPWSTSATGILLVYPLARTHSDARMARPPPRARHGGRRLAGVTRRPRHTRHGLGRRVAGGAMGWRRGHFFKPLVIPLLLVQFRRSERGWWVFAAYVGSCIALLVISTFIHDPTKLDGVLVKNAATQSGEFVTCIFGVLYVAVECIERRRRWWLAGMAAVMLGMLANILYVATGRTALVIIPVLVVLFAAKNLSARGIAVLFACVIAIAAVGWLSSPYLRDRTTELWTAYQAYRTTTPTRHPANASSSTRNR